MDCFNHLCPFRQNTTSNCNRCECLACQNRQKEPVTYIVSNRTLTADEIARMTNNPDYGVGAGWMLGRSMSVDRCSDMLEGNISFMKGARYVTISEKYTLPESRKRKRGIGGADHDA